MSSPWKRLGPLAQIRLQVSGLYAALYSHYGLLTFLPLWLASRQVPATQIGALMAIPLFLRLVAVAPVVSRAGRRGRLRDALTLFAVLSALGAGSFGGLYDHTVLLVVFVLFSLGWDQLPVLADAYAVLAARARGLDFGRLRVWGSFGVIAGSAVGGAVFDQIGIQALPFLSAGLLLLLALVSRLTPSDRHLAGQHELDAGGTWKAVLADRPLVAAMISLSLIAGSHGILTSFGAIQWSGKGWSTTTTGLLVALAVLSEIVVLWFGERALRGRDPRGLIFVGGLASVARWGCMAFDPNLAVVICLQALNAVTAIAPIFGMMLLIARRTPMHLMGAAQGLNAVVLGLGLSFTTVASGFLWQQGLVVAYGAMAIMAALALPLLLVGSARAATRADERISAPAA